MGRVALVPECLGEVDSRQPPESRSGRRELGRGEGWSNVEGVGSLNGVDSNRGQSAWMRERAG